MIGEVDDLGAGRDPQVWLLGNSHPAADRSIAWRGRLPNLGDPDVLIVDMTTLTEETLRGIDDAELDRAQRSIDDKFFGGGGAIIVITQPEFSAPPKDPLTLEPKTPPHARLAGPHAYSSYRILPAVPETVAVPAGRRIRPDDGHDFKAYLNGIGHFTFYIAKWRPRAACAPGRAISPGKVPGQSVMDNSGNHLGFTLVPKGHGYATSHPKHAVNEGKLVLLPPYTEPAGDAIGKILSACRKAPPCGEAPPPWAESLSFAKADTLQEQIAELEARAGGTQATDLRRRRGDILGHRRLLHAKGPELESAVVNALRTLGFSEAMQLGGPDQADCIIDIYTAGYLHGLVEVEGADGRTGKRHISRCVKWVDKKHGLDGRMSKGIFVPNQHRNAEYPGSIKDRLWFEAKEVEYAEMKNVCIIPSCVLFEAARKAIDKKAPDRAVMEAKIARTRGVLERVF